MDLSNNYPSNGPAVGFCTIFPYEMGATMNISSGRLSGL
jgi:hypothetical protein